MQLNDCIHFYLGCECVNSWFPPDDEAYNKGWKLTAINTSNYKPYKLETDNDYTWTDSVKPVLRRIESMTEEDKKDMLNRFSRFDLSGCTYEYSDFPDIWINAIVNGRVIESLSVDLSDHVVSIMNDASDMRPYRSQSDTFHYLISKRFDLFDLIDSGQAIDTETLKQQP